jgi:hypothetical protein
MAKRTRPQVLISGTPSASPSKSPPKSVDVFYDKAAQHRTIYADGVWAGITPSLELQMVFFKNLAPVPEYSRIEVTPTNKLGGELESVTKKGMIREYQSTIVLSRETAEAMLQLLERIMKQTKAVEKANKGTKTR